MIEDILRNKLLTNATLTNLVGNRIFVQEAPQGVQVPYIVYLIVSVSPEYCQNYESDEITIQYSVFAQKYADARNIAGLIRQELSGFSGVLDGEYMPMIIFDSQGANERDTTSRLAHISYDFKIRKN